MHDKFTLNLTLKSDQELLELLVSGDLDARKPAVHKLGDRQNFEAIPFLSGLLEDNSWDLT